MSADYLDLPQLVGARGTLRLPGSKSISNRVLLLAALAEGATEVRDLLESGGPLCHDVLKRLFALEILPAEP